MKKAPALCVGLLVGSGAFVSIGLLRAEPPPPAATTAAVEPQVIPHSIPALGLKLDLPRNWDVAPVRNRKGTRVLEVVDASPAPANRVWVRAKLSVKVRESEIRESFKLDGPRPARATVSEVIEVDGLKARLTGYMLPDGEQEMLMLRLAKPLPRGTRVLEIDMFFDARDRATYLALAREIFRSVQFLPDAPAPAADPKPDHPAQVDGDHETVSRVRRLWAEVAAGQGIGRAGVEVTSNRLKAAVGPNAPDIAPEQLVGLKRSLERVVATNTQAFGEATWSNGSSYYLATLVADWLRRISADEKRADEEHKLARSYADAVDKIVDEANRRLMEALPEGKRTAWQGQIDELSAALRKELQERVAQLRADPLFPAYRRELRPPDIDAILTMLNKSKVYPAFEDPPAMMQTADEWYRNRLQQFRGHFIWESLFWIAAREVRPQLSNTQVFGQMHVGSESVSFNKWDWPIAVRLTPVRTTTRAQGGGHD